MKNSLYCIERFALSVLVFIFLVPIHAQTIGDVFYIYRNDGGFNAFFRDEVDSIAYSNYDLDSLRYDEVVTQLIYTVDSLYRIPLAAIDSVSFVQPETIYKEDAKPIIGELFDYLIKVDSLLLTFNLSTPSSILPVVGDKLVATELTDKLPLGFTGTVRLVEMLSDGYLVTCDSLDLEDVVDQFYSVVEMVGQEENGSVRRYLRRKVYSEQTTPYRLVIPSINQKLDLSPLVNPKEVYTISGKAVATATINPVISGKITRVVDNVLNISHYNIHTVTDVKTVSQVEAVGQVANSDNPLNLSSKETKFSIEGTKPGPWGIPVYYAFGPKFEMSGEIALGTTVYANFSHTEDITFYPLATAIGVVTPGLTPWVNRVNTRSGSTKMTYFDIDWAYIAGKISACVAVVARLGIGLAAEGHNIGWVGGEAQIGAKAEAELGFDIEALSKAEKGTGFYDGLKDKAKITVMPYWGLEGKISVVDDRFSFTFLGRDNYTFWGQKWEWDFLPIFSDTKAVMTKGACADVSANITNDCIIPYTVGFTLFDENNNRIGEPWWDEQKYWTRNNFSLPLETTFCDLATDVKYKVYPTLRLLGINVLASPSANLDMKFPVELSDFMVTMSEYKKNGFSNNGLTYDYSFNVSVTATLDEGTEDISDWGYAYLDPLGHETLISLKTFGTSYTDTRYAYYRNETNSSCTLYGYVKYEGSDEPIFGEPHDYLLDYSCKDDRHPHLVDLGLPSGLRWNCTNLGASVPEGYGGYYAYAELSEKNNYTEQNYKYYHWDTMFNDQYSYYEAIGAGIQNFGISISGKKGYDVVLEHYDDGRRMPTHEELQELVDNCTWTWTFRNQIPGYEVKGTNGNTIFLPASGAKAQGTNYAGEANRLTYYRSAEWSDQQWGTKGFGWTWGLKFKEGSYEVVKTCAKAFGYVIRPVKTQEQ